MGFLSIALCNCNWREKTFCYMFIILMMMMTIMMIVTRSPFSWQTKRKEDNWINWRIYSLVRSFFFFFFGNQRFRVHSQTIRTHYAFTAIRMAHISGNGSVEQQLIYKYIWAAGCALHTCTPSLDRCQHSHCSCVYLYTKAVHCRCILSLELASSHPTKLHCDVALC